jgi:acyl transferase domain-containing protein
MDLDAAAELIAVRGSLMGALPPGGAMVAVFTDEDRVRRLVEPHRDHVSIAAVNGPGNVVLSGAGPAVDAILAALHDVSRRVLQVSHAFHSPLMAPMVEALGERAEAVAYRRPSLAFVSSVTGAAETDAVATPTYWRDQVLATVRFGAAVDALRQTGIEHFLEIGPQATLLGMVARIAGDDCGLHASLRPHGERDERSQLADAAGSLWTAGVEIDWRAVDRGRSVKVDLPTYPFQRQRYWLPGMDGASALPSPAAVPHDQPLYEPVWVRLAPSPAPAPATGPWLVVGGAESVAAELEHRGHHVERVATASHIEAAGTWAGIVLGRPAAAGPDDPVAGQRDRLEPLLVIVQRLLADEVRLAEGARVWVLTTNGQSVVPDSPPVDLVDAPLWGLANAVTVEEPNLRCACIDVDTTGAGAVALVVAELLGDDAEDRIAVRDGRRYGLRLSRLHAAPSDGGGLAAGGAYLVTGGLGALGLNAARSLAARGAEHIALLARRNPSDAAIRAITELRDAGLTVTVFQGDVADAARVDAVIAEIRATVGPLRGVIHAAGVLDDGTLRNLDWSRFESVARAKVAGAWNLHRATLDDPLDFFVLYSSAAALLGSSGQANYIAANAFLDALAHHRQGRGLPALSIDWSGWDEAGMAARLDAGQRSRLVQTGIALIDPVMGDELLGALLTSPTPQVGVVPVDWHEVARRSPAAMHRPFYELLRADALAGVPAGPAPGSLIAELAALDADDRYDHVRDHVEAAIVAVLGLEDVTALEAGLGLVELGMDSLMAVDLCNRLQWSTGVPLQSTLAFEWPSLEAMSRHLAHDLLGVPAIAATGDSYAARAAAVAERAAAERMAEIEAISELEAEASLLEALERSGY